MLEAIGAGAGRLFAVGWLLWSVTVMTTSTDDADFKYAAHARYKRQFETSAAPKIDLNTTVPYIFSARLYPFGAAHGDETLAGELHALRLQTPFYFLDKIYDAVYIRRDGAIGLAAGTQSPTVLPLTTPIIAVYWLNTSAGRVFYRESTDQSILTVAQNEVNIQYRYGNDFQTRSVIIVTWEDVVAADGNTDKASRGSVFQVALILGDNACFAHFVYSRLEANTKATAGFNGALADNTDDSPLPAHFSLPGSGTPHAAQLIEKSNIGIPGEWLFRIDEERIYLCGAGFQGLECVDPCSPTQWYLDCARQCHCADGNACNAETGECPDSRCSPGWEGAPICDTDVDECADPETTCPGEQPDCVNTPGAYLCLCFEYNNSTNTCKNSGGRPTDGAAETIPVPVMPLVPLLVASTTHAPTRARSSTTGAPIPSSLPVLNADGETTGGGDAFEVTPPEGDASPFVVSTLINSGASNGPTISLSTHSPLTIQPILGRKEMPKPSVQFGTPFAAGLNRTASMSSLDASIGRTPFGDSLTSSMRRQQPQAPTRVNHCDRCHQMAQCVVGHCLCVPGWTGDGENCEDLDECQNLGACGGHAECQNTVGSYQCICDIGFIATANGCVDIDECTEGLAVCRGGNTSMCVNTMGGYECRCRSGFIGNPDDVNGCVDVDECQNSRFHCGDRAHCHNTPGTFACQCFKGYEPMALEQLSHDGPPLASSMRPCVDVDECARQPSPCHVNATCTNMEGAFRCECVDGFVGDGIDCRETILFPIGRNVTVIEDPSAAMALDVPITVFRKTYSSVYVSPYGLISFDQPLPGLIRSAPSELRIPALLPYHLAFNRQTSGPVTLAQFSGAPNGNDQLMKASLLVQSKMHVQDFQATALYVITFDRMHELNIEKLNTFQVLIIRGVDESTYVAFLYDTLESTPRGVAGVAAADGFSSVPMTPSPSATSNVGQRARWLFRIDSILHSSAAIVCPAGRMGPPFCELNCKAGTWGFECANACHCANGTPCDARTGFCTNSRCEGGFTGFNCSVDVDECTTGQHHCHENATCHNAFGSYSCRCGADFSGDGRFCEAIDRCMLRFNAPCAPNGHCDVTSPDLPECVCENGFHGDGRRECVPDDERTTASSVVKLTVSSSSKSTRGTLDGMVDMNFLDKDGRVRPTKPPPKDRSSIGSRTTAGMDDELSKSEVRSHNETEVSADSSGMLLIFGPIVFCIIWLLLVIVFLIICFYKRRRTRAEKYTPQMMGWSPREYATTRGTSYITHLTQ